jgi:hypothetical protein
VRFKLKVVLFLITYVRNTYAYLKNNISHGREKEGLVARGEEVETSLDLL